MWIFLIKSDWYETGYFAFLIAQNIAPVALQQRAVAICLFLDELIFPLFRVWGSELGISNRYTSFKMALDMALTLYPKGFTIELSK